MRSLLHDSTHSADENDDGTHSENNDDDDSRHSDDDDDDSTLFVRLRIKKMLNDHAIIHSLMFLQKAWRAGDRMIKTQRLQSVDIMLFDLGFHSSGQSLKNLRKDFKRGDNGGWVGGLRSGGQ